MALRALSEQRQGALVLIPADDSQLPKTVAQIDTSTLAAVLNQQLETATFDEVYRANAALQVLSSDGLTIMSAAGKLLGCGRIIDIAGAVGSTGGGRTQAAVAASSYGLAIKVSEDGPIVAFQNGARL